MSSLQIFWAHKVAMVSLYEQSRDRVSMDSAKSWRDNRLFPPAKKFSSVLIVKILKLMNYSGTLFRKKHDTW